MMRFLLCIFFFVLPITLSTQVLSAIHFHFEGKLRRTDTQFLKEILQCKVGMPFQPEMVLQDEQSLKNLGVFYGVWHDLKDTASGDKILTFYLKEGLTLLPQLRLNVADAHPDLQLNVQENHLGGRANALSVRLRHYDRLSAEVSAKFPRLNKGFGVALEAGIKRTNEPLYLAVPVLYKVNIPQYRAFVLYDVFPRYSKKQIQIHLGGGLLQESYEKINPQNPGPTAVRYEKYLSQIGAQFSKMQVYPRHLQGLQVNVGMEQILGDGKFQKIQLSTKWAKRLSASSNLLNRLHIGLATQKNSPFQPFVLDSYQNVRGIGNRVRRGNGEFSLNTEFRHDFWLRKNLAVQGVAFSDVAFWQEGNLPINTAFRKENRYFFAGGGLRLYFQQVFEPILRIDFAFNLKDLKQNQFIIGSGHYF